jgi:2'-5' RNA ligase
MRAAIALLADEETANVVRKLAWRLHLRHGTGTWSRRIEPHISLKQPFGVADMDALEGYVDGLADEIAPFKVRLPRVELVEHGQETGILWYAVEEIPLLRELHERLNRDLKAAAEFDGDDYRFHMAIALGGRPLEVYRRAHAELAGEPVDRVCRLERLALMVYEEPIRADGEFMTYKVLRLG